MMMTMMRIRFSHITGRTAATSTSGKSIFQKKNVKPIEHKMLNKQQARDKEVSLQK